ncbi:hypothetical protein [Azospirillum sp. B4]|uniref:hypothetical protein n=1 Tax=Azospirillum sp. B4 TaxID=95605 RepID=UPI00034B8D98|nr:hypothetical protein [Azospirillum sp. B4]
MPPRHHGIPTANVAAKLIITVLITYPLGRLLYGMGGALHAAVMGESKVALLMMFIAFNLMVVVPLGGGFAPGIGGSGMGVNLYPWITPTAIVVFFILTKGWRWFRR